MLPTLFFAAEAAAKTIQLDWNIGWVKNVDPTGGLFKRDAIGVNGQWPIPPVIATLGDRLVIRATNHLNESTSIHFHGLFQNGTTYMDGALGATQCGIAPGRSFTYDFELKQTGSYWLHGHFLGQYPDGFRTPLIIKDPKEHYQYADDYVVGLADWYQNGWAEVFKNDFFVEDNQHGIEPAPNTVLINDKAKQYFTFAPGKTYRFRFVSMATLADITVYIENHNFTIIEVDGVEVEPYQVQAITLSTAQRYSVLVTAQKATKYNYKLHAVIDFDNAPETNYRPDTVAEIRYKKNAPYFNYTADVPDSEFEEMDLVPLEKLGPLPPDEYHQYNIIFNYFNDNRNHGSFNNTVFQFPKVPAIYTAQSGAIATNDSSYGPATNSRVLGFNKNIQIGLINNDKEAAHPFHLHGHQFQIVGKSYNRFKTFNYEEETAIANNITNPVRRDTVLVPRGGWVLLRFRSDNPGIWLLHCHIQWHLATGLAAQVIEAPLELQKKQKIPQSAKDLCAATKTPTFGNAAGFNNTYQFDGLPDPLQVSIIIGFQADAGVTHGHGHGHTHKN
ncbi:Cupredoxin [Gorgonomyces haynaldii]|nr:Cupredoxin [Gorgonomyces haynaldii]